MRRMRRPGRFGRRCTPSCRRIHGVGATQVGTTRGRSRRFWRTCGRSSSNASARSSTVRPLACGGCHLRRPAEGCGCGVAGGDTDACVPFTGGQDWTTAMAAAQGWPQIDDWAPCAQHHQASPVLSIRPELFVWQGMSTIKWPVTLLTTRSMPRRTSPSSPCVATACWLPCLVALPSRAHCCTR